MQAAADDPLAWFYSNQINSEKEFQAKKEALRKQARQKLDEVGAACL